MMHYDVMFHLLFVYIGLHCASLSAVLMFEAEQFYSRIISGGCGKIMRIESDFYNYSFVIAEDYKQFPTMKPSQIRGANHFTYTQHGNN